MINKINLGDVFELKTKKGFAYIQFLFQHPSWGEVVRLLPGLYKKQPDLDELVKKEELYKCFLLLSVSFKAKMLNKVASIDTIEYEKPKYMRSPIIVRNKFFGWHIVDTETLHRRYVYKLNSKEIRLSPFGTWNLALLIQRIEEGWSLENWQEKIEAKFGSPIKAEKDELLI